MYQSPQTRALAVIKKISGEVLPPQEIAAVGNPEPAASASARRAKSLALRSFAADDPLHETSKKATKFIKAARADATLRAYKSDWNDFKAWCLKQGLCSLPAEPETVALYLSDLAEPPEGETQRKPSTITRRLTAITHVHQAQGFDSPAAMRHKLVADALHGIRRTLGTAPTMKKPMTRERIVTVIGSLECPITAARDKALLLLGFAGGLRRAELAAMRVEHIKRHRKGITINLPKSKTDQEGKGRQIEVLYGVHDLTCPILALDNWLKIAGIEDGFVLRRVWLHGEKIGKALSKDSIGRIVKRMVRQAKLDDPDEYGGHSLRAGFVTEASANGATDRQIMKQTGHKSVAMVHRYSREDQSDRQIAYSKLGL